MYVMQISGMRQEELHVPPSYRLILSIDPRQNGTFPHWLGKTICTCNELYIDNAIWKNCDIMVVLPCRSVYKVKVTQRLITGNCWW